MGSRQTLSEETTYNGTDNETDVDAYSIAGTDIGDDEFFDCSDSEGGAGDLDNRFVYFHYHSRYTDLRGFIIFHSYVAVEFISLGKKG